MKKTISFIVMLCLAFIMTTSYAANGYDFRLDYSGDIVKNVQKDAKVVLVGTEGTLHPHVRVKIDIQGPSIPNVYAYDTSNNKIDIAQTGYWGPPEGFAIQGTFENVTPIQAIFKDAGDYVINLSLLDVDNGNAVITAKSFSIHIKETPSTIVNNTVDVTEIPKTGIGIGEYILITVAILGIVYMVFKTRKNHS